MSNLAKINYLIALCVLILGFIASYLTLNRKVEIQKEIQPAVFSPIQSQPAVESNIPARSMSGLSEENWRFDCQLSLEGMENCTAVQKIYWKDGQDLALVAVLMQTKRNGADVPRLQFVVPLGTFLPAGISMALAGEQPFIVPFQFCVSDGCFVNLDLAPDVVELMKNGGAMRVEYLDGNQALASVDVSLDGFEAALIRISQ